MPSKRKDKDTSFADTVEHRCAPSAERLLLAKHRGLTEKLNQFEVFVTELDGESLSDVMVMQLQCRVDNIKTLLSQYEQCTIELECYSHQIAQTESQTFMNKYFENVALANQYIAKLTEQNKSITASQSLSSTSSVRVNSNELHMKMKHIEIPTFKGDYRAWITFRDFFVAAVHNNSHLTNVEKFFHLKASLADNALQIIFNIPTSDQGYLTAWDILNKRFENEKLIIHDHIKAIFDFPPLSKENRLAVRELLDNLTRNLRALENLKRPTDKWSDLLVYLITGKLDDKTRRAFTEFTAEEIPTIEVLKTFLEKRCIMLEQMDAEKVNQTASCRSTVKAITNLRVGKEQSYTAATTPAQHRVCKMCKESHSIYQCSAFLKLTPVQRHAKAKELKLCGNCLGAHFIMHCSSSSACKTCGKRHHSLLHFNSNSAVSNSVDSGRQEIPTENQSTVLVNHSVQSQIMLATADVKLRDMRGNLHSCRCLLDSGSQSHFVTESFCDKLGVLKMDTAIRVQGVNSASSNVTKQVTVRMFSHNLEFNSDLSCLVVPTITGVIPTQSFRSNALKLPRAIVSNLADPEFNKAKPVDLLIGASLFWELLLNNRIVVGRGQPIYQETRLGWVITGPLKIPTSFVQSHCCVNNRQSFDSDQSLDNSLTRFWEIEEIQHPKSTMSSEEIFCEDHFARTHYRDESGRFVVSIPFNQFLPELGESQHYTTKRFYQLESKLAKNPNLRQQYSNFMAEYSSLNHMLAVTESQIKYYIPHHAVLKESSLSTKLRVVFDASMKTSSGWSLNQTQNVGPTVQSDLLSIIIRFRQYRFVLTGDIKMMYRQININPEDRKYQGILWRETQEERLSSYQLNTVTYGTASAPYLATKCLQQLSSITKISHPVASNIIENDFYVDDLLTGSDTIEALIQIREEVVQILKSAQFELRKFISNHPAILEKVANEDDSNLMILNFGEHENCKTLGITWNAHEDTIRYEIQKRPITKTQITKRKILSIISAIFDLLGLVGPVIIKAKLFMQDLWEHQIGWDDDVPEHLQSVWLQFQEELPKLNSLKIPRHVLLEDSVIIEIHGFCDASEKAYGACVYLRSVNAASKVTVNLLIAKSRVAPLRKITLPRLELCGAVLLSQLFEKVQISLRLQVSKYYFWCDSCITVAWIKAPPNRWKTFVANRVAEIQSRTDVRDWFHVSSKDNPADLISRGVTPSELLDQKLWFHGPLFLSEVQLFIRTEPSTASLKELPEYRQQTSCCSNIILSKDYEDSDIFARMSSFIKLCRVAVMVFRWRGNASDKINKRSGPISASELQAAKERLIQIAQARSFAQDIHQLKIHNRVDSKSRILPLNPFLDKKQILRVGGRLSLTNFDFDKKHPILLCSKHPLTLLIMRSEHVRLHHCGPQALAAAVRETYWPLSIRNLSRLITRQCIQCFKVKPTTSTPPIMGDLPACRTELYSVFNQVGVDYSGPFHIKTHKLRGAKLIKSWVALFVCLSTKAIHLEPVTDLTSDAFIAAFRRFVARRGKPHTVFSDNGTTFVKANTDLRELHQFLASKFNQTKIIDSFSFDNITSHFIPPSSPTFGGIWEAGVKSMKHHLRRVVGNAHVTYEDFYTILAQIEAILNSRPLCPLSADPSDVNSLTPGHFLIGRSVSSLPERILTEILESRLSRFERCQQLVQHYWTRWSKEYVSELQARSKWRINHQQLVKKDALVIIKEDHLPPLKWHLGRVVAVHPGRDNVVRVVTLKTATGMVKRAVTKICVLPLV